MSLILCRQEPVKIPLYIEDLGIHIYSSQELCYVIYNNPLLVLEDFIDSRLTEFLRSELRMPFLAEKIEKWMESRGATEEILYLILQECNYYSPKEQAAYRQTVNGLKKLTEEEYKKRRADYFYGLDLCEAFLLPEGDACLRERLECKGGGGVCEAHVLPHGAESGA